jgi:hypothetical protein
MCAVKINLIELPVKSTLIILILTFFSTPLFAQDIGFMGLNIGMSREEVLNFADADDLIKVPKNRDVEFFPVEDRKILTLSVLPEIPSIYLQFYDDVLYAITVNFNDKYVDYYTLFEVLGSKYGPYTELVPDWRKWLIGGIEIRVEKPAVVKYIALDEFIEAAGFQDRSGLTEGERRDRILEGL